MLSDEWSEWIAYNALSPFGPEREDALFASICFTIASALGADKCVLQDFMLDFESAREPAKQVKMTPDMLKMIFTMGGENVIDKRNGHNSIGNS